MRAGADGEDGEDDDDDDVDVGYGKRPGAGTYNKSDDGGVRRRWRESSTKTDAIAMEGPVRARHETLNGRLKNWGILSQVFHHDIGRHGEVLRACATVTQLTINDGEPLFKV